MIKHRHRDGRRVTHGFHCPYCDNESTEVKDSRSVEGRVRRRRTCSSCGSKFSTLEVPVDQLGDLHAGLTLKTATRSLNQFIHHYNILRRDINNAAKRNGQ